MKKQVELSLNSQSIENTEITENPQITENKEVTNMTTTTMTTIDFDTKFTNAKGQLDQLTPKLLTILLSETVKKDKICVIPDEDFVAITSKNFNGKQYTNCLYVAWDVIDNCPKIFNPFGFPLNGEIINYKIRKSPKDESSVNVIVAGIELILPLKHYNHDIDDGIKANTHTTLLPGDSNISPELLLGNKITPCYSSDLPEGRDFIINSTNMIDDSLYLHLTSLEKTLGKDKKGSKLNRLDVTVLADRTLRKQSGKGFKTFTVVKHSQNKGKDGKTYTDTSYIFN